MSARILPGSATWPLGILREYACGVVSRHPRVHSIKGGHPVAPFHPAFQDDESEVGGHAAGIYIS